MRASFQTVQICQESQRNIIFPCSFQKEDTHGVFKRSENTHMKVQISLHLRFLLIFTERYTEISKREKIWFSHTISMFPGIKNVFCLLLQEDTVYCRQYCRLLVMRPAQNMLPIRDKIGRKQKRVADYPGGPKYFEIIKNKQRQHNVSVASSALLNKFQQRFLHFQTKRRLFIV